MYTYSRILQSTVFLVSIRCKAVPTVRAHIWFILLYYFMIPQLLYMLCIMLMLIPPIRVCVCVCVNSLLSCICHIAIKFININCLQLLQKHIVFTLMMMVIINALALPFYLTQFVCTCSKNTINARFTFKLNTCMRFMLWIRVPIQQIAHFSVPSVTIICN